MKDETLQRKLNSLVRIANELDDEAKRRYGKEGNLFFEGDGTFHIMAGDVDDSGVKRQEFIRASSHGYCRMGSGAW